MAKKRRLYSISSVVIIAAFLYQASSFIPISLPPLFSGTVPWPIKWGLSPLVSFASEPKAKKVELADKRREHSKTYLNEDGSLTTEVSQEPVNYKDKDGKLKPIDTTLVKDADGFKVSENSLSVDFGNRASNLVNISTKEGNSSLTYKALEGKGQLSPVKKADSKLTYENYKEATDLTYEVQEGRLKEEIILDKPPKEATFSFELDLKSLKPKQEKNGSISLLNKEGKTSLVIERPYMEDANSSDIYAPPETFSSYDIDMKLTPKQGSTYTLTLTPNKEWLEDESRVYPVRIDPTFSVPNTSTADTYIRSTASGSSFGGEERVYVGGWSNTDQTKALMKFDLSSIPENATINSATLNLTKRETLESNINAGNYNQFNTNTRLFRTTTDWNEFSSYSSMASNFDPSMLSQRSEDSPSFDVTTTVNNWSKGTYPNYGFMLDNTSEVKLIDDSSPGGSPYQTPSPWSMTTSPVHSGSLAHREPNKSGTHQHYYLNSSYPFFIPAYSWIRSWIYPSSVYRPSEAMLQYNASGDWSHRAYWGYNYINWGTNGTASRYYRGGLPASGSYSSLSVRADMVGLNNTNIIGAAFTLYNGYAVFDEVQTWRTQNFYTREASVSADQKPKLTVNYSVQAVGRENYKTYKDYSGASVDLFNGNLLAESADLTIAGRGLSTNVTRTYNSLAYDNTDTAQSFNQAYGWRFYPDSLRVYKNGSSVVVATESGSLHAYYGPDANGKFSSKPKGVEDDLYQNPDGSLFLKRRDNSKIEFNSTGQAVKEIDKNGNTLLYQYGANGHISSVTDANNRVTTFDYLPDSNLVSKIVDFTNRSVSYEYANGNLDKVTYPDNRSISYEYDKYRRLITISNQLNKSTRIKYGTTDFNDANRVVEIINPLGKKTGFKYNLKEADDSNTDAVEKVATTVTEPEGYEPVSANHPKDHNTHPNNHQFTYKFSLEGLVTQIGEPLGASPQDEASEQDPSTGADLFPDDEMVESEAAADYDAFEDEADDEGYDEEILTPPETITGLVDGKTTYYQYDSDYNVIKQINKDKSFVTTKFENGNKTEEVVHNHLVTETTFDEPFDISKHIVTRNEYGANNNLTKQTSVISEADSTKNKSTTYVYDANAINLESETDPENNTTSYTYDEFGNQVTQTSPEGGLTTNIYSTEAGKEGLFLTETIDAAQVSTTYTYDELGNKLTEKKAGMNALTYKYDIMSRQTDQINPANDDGQYLINKSYYNDDGSKAKDELYELTTNKNYEIKSDGIFEIAADASLSKLSPKSYVAYEYDEGGQLTKQSEYPSGAWTAYQYDASGNKTEETKLIDNTDPANPKIAKTTYEYDALNRIIKETQPDGNFTAYKYDAVGNVVKEGTPDGTSVTLYDKTGNEIANTSPDGSTSKTVYDKEGNERIAGDDSNNLTKTRYDDNGNIMGVTDAQTASTTYSYDGDQNEEEVNAPPNNIPWINPNSTNSSTSTASLLSTLTGVTDTLNPDTIADYNAAGQLMKEIDQNGQITSTTYKPTTGVEESIMQPNDLGQKMDYDMAGNVVKTEAIKAADSDVSLANSSNISTDYDAGGNPTKATTINAATGEVESKVSTTYDEAGRIKTLTDLLGITVNFEYDAAGNLTKLSDSTPLSSGQAGAITYTYDSSSKLTKISSPLAGEGQGEGVTTFNYGQSGNLEKTTLPNGVTTDPEYDAASKIEKLVNQKGTETISSYDYTYENGNIKTVNEGDGTIIYEYDDLNRLTNVTNKDATQTAYVYDAQGNRLKKEEKEVINDVLITTKTTSYEYSLANELMSAVSYTYNDDPTRAMLSQSGLTAFCAFCVVDDGYYAHGAWHTDSSTAGAYLKMDLGDGNAKNYTRARIYASTSGYAGNYNVQYSDDGSSWANAVTNFVPSSAGWNEKAWDSVGAHRYWRLYLTNTPGPGSWLNELEMYSNSAVSTQQSAVSYTYDENGNTTSKIEGTEITTYAYDNKNQLVKVIMPNGDTVEYTYDGEGKRYSKIVNGTTRYYHYDSEGNIVLETKKVVIPSGGEESQVLVKYIRDTSGKAISMIQGTNTYYFMYNAHGDVTSLTDSQGNTVATYSYDEFGNQVAGTGYGVQGTEIYNPIQYSGANNAYYDEETASASSGQAGLYKMGARYYDSSTGRWITRDSYKGEQEGPQTQNKYIYVENDPINQIDPTGNLKESIRKLLDKSKPGDILLTYGGKIQGSFTPGRWTHAAMRIQNDWIRNKKTKRRRRISFLAEANSEGVKIRAMYNRFRYMNYADLAIYRVKKSQYKNKAIKKMRYFAIRLNDNNFALKSNYKTFKDGYNCAEVIYRAWYNVSNHQVNMNKSLFFGAIKPDTFTDPRYTKRIK